MQLNKTIPIETILATELPSEFFATQIKEVLKEENKAMTGQTIFSKLTTRFSGMDNVKTKGQFFGTISSMLRFDDELDCYEDGKKVKNFFIAKLPPAPMKNKTVDQIRKELKMPALGGVQGNADAITGEVRVHLDPTGTIPNAYINKMKKDATTKLEQSNFSKMLNQYAAELVEAKQNYDAKLAQLTNFVQNEGTK